MMEEKKGMQMPHHLLLEDRKNLHVTGVLDIDSFDETVVNLLTEMGSLSIKGEDLHINSLSVDSGELLVEGEIYSLVYTNDTPKNTSFLSRLFR